MKFKKKATSILVIGAILISNMSFVFADGSKVVSIGTNLSQEQKDTMMKYFGVKDNEAMVFEVNNEQERKYLEGIVPDAQIGRKTYSCAYVEPTNKDEINVKTVNLTYVTSNMISSAVATATGGKFGANIVAGSPFEVSGTGALTGILLALEDATGEAIDEDKKELANEEMIITGEISEDIGAEKATGVINSIKTEVIKNNTSDTTQIANTINNITNNYNINLSSDQQKKIEELMLKISEQNYNYKEMKDTLENINKDINDKLDEMGESIQTGILDTIKSWFTGFGEWISGLFNSDKDLGILENTNDELLGENVQIDATNKDAINLPSSEEVQGFFAKIWNWFTGLFSGNNDKEVEETTPNDEVLFDNESPQENSNTEDNTIEINEDLNTETTQELNKDESLENSSEDNTNNSTESESTTDKEATINNDSSTDLEDDTNTEIQN